MRFSDIKVPTVLLSLALVYDVFWVFISPLLFISIAGSCAVTVGRAKLLPCSMPLARVRSSRLSADGPSRALTPVEVVEYEGAHN